MTSTTVSKATSSPLPGSPIMWSDECETIARDIKTESEAERVFLDPVFVINGDTPVSSIGPDAYGIVSDAHAKLEAIRAALEQEIKAGSNTFLISLGITTVLLAALCQFVDPVVWAVILLCAIVTFVFIASVNISRAEHLNKLSLRNEVAKEQAILSPVSLSYLISAATTAVHTSNHLLLGERGLAFRWSPVEASYIPYSRVTSVSAGREPGSDRPQLNIRFDLSDVASKPFSLLLTVRFPSVPNESAQDIAMRIAETVARLKGA